MGYFPALQIRIKDHVHKPQYFPKTNQPLWCENLCSPRAVMANLL